MDAPLWLSTGGYVAMGYVVLVAAPVLIVTLPLGGIAWLAVGGIAYIGGAVVFVLGRPALRPGTFGAHAL